MLRSRVLQPWSPTKRAAIAFMGFMIFGAGGLALMGGHLHYANYWGGSVFAPFALVIGGLCFFVALSKGKGIFSSAMGPQSNQARLKGPAVVPTHQKKVSRNAPCPCGSDLKYKHCCLSKDEERERQDHELDQRRKVDVMEGPAETFRRVFDRRRKPPKG